MRIDRQDDQPARHGQHGSAANGVGRPLTRAARRARPARLRVCRLDGGEASERRRQFEFRQASAALVCSNRIDCWLNGAMMHLQCKGDRVKQPAKDVGTSASQGRRTSSSEIEDGHSPKLALRRRMQQARDDADRSEGKKPQSQKSGIFGPIDKKRLKATKARKWAIALIEETHLGQTPEINKNNVDVPVQKFSPKGRTLRRAFERPRPDLPANAQENRTRKPVTATLPPDLIEQVNDRCRELGVDRTAFIEAAIRQALKPS